MGSRLSSAVSLGSLNHDLMGMALSVGHKRGHEGLGGEKGGRFRGWGIWGRVLGGRCTRVAAVGARRVVEDDDAGKVPMNHRKVLDVTAQLQRAVLGVGTTLDTPPSSVATPPPHPPSGTAQSAHSQWGQRREHSCGSTDQ